MVQLPEELIVEILLWLLVKSLKRFRCFSKSLCAVIDSPDFINWHLSRSSQNINHRKLIFPDHSKKKFHVFDFPEDETLRLGEPVSSSAWRIVFGNYKGLLFYGRTGYLKYSFALWNPSTRQYRDLPDCPFPFQVPPNGTGLGYDDSTDDYKAILRVHVNEGTGVEVQVWIYGLKSNMWTRAPNFPYIECNVNEDEGFPGIGYFADGSLHWIRTLLISGVRRKEIVAFDMRKETFSLLPQPTTIFCLINSVVSVSPKLHVLEGCLCVSVSNLFSSKPNQVDLFIRKKKDGAEKFSWTKLFSLTEEPLPSDIDWLYNLTVLGYSKRGYKILIDIGDKANMVAYDLKEKCSRKVEIDKDASRGAPFLCLESLVFVGSRA